MTTYQEQLKIFWADNKTRSKEIYESNVFHSETCGCSPRPPISDRMRFAGKKNSVTNNNSKKKGVKK
jgi:hypothetical protein